MLLTEILRSSIERVQLFFVDHKKDIIPLEIGINFSHRYAKELGLQWDDAFDELVEHLKINRIRIPTYWDEIESIQGRFDWSILDQLLVKAETKAVKVLLTIGHRSPRYPECYCPAWANFLAEADFNTCLLQYLSAVISHAKQFSCIEAWQVENEPLATRWGVGCRNIVQLLSAEIDVVKQEDPDRKVVLTYPNLPWVLSQHRQIMRFSDIAGVDVYDKVWFEYRGCSRYLELLKGGVFAPLSLSYQRFLAEQQQKDLWVTELQAEPWGPAHNVSLGQEESRKSMSPIQLETNIKYVQDAGITRVYLWGAEWWLFQRDIYGDRSMWDTACCQLMSVNLVASSLE